MKNRRILVVDTFNEDTRYKIILSIIVVSLLYFFLAKLFFVTLPVSTKLFTMEHEQNRSQMTQERDDLQDIVGVILSKFTILELSLPQIRLATHDQLIRMRER